MNQIFGFKNYDELIITFQNSIYAAIILGLVGGLISVLIMVRDVPFAVHGLSELSFAGAALGLLLGLGVGLGAVLGSIVAACLIGFFGHSPQHRNALTAVIMPFGLGLGILALALYPGRSANKFGLLTGQIVAIDKDQLDSLMLLSALVLVLLLVFWRPLFISSVDPQIAAARGWPVGLISLGFMGLLGLAVAVAVQIIGALLVLAILVAPAAAALRVAKSPRGVLIYSLIFALLSMVGGVLLALGGNLPISPYITTIAFLIYIICRTVGRKSPGAKTRRSVHGRMGA